MIQTAMPVRGVWVEQEASQHSKPATHLGQAGRSLERPPVQARMSLVPLQQHLPSRGLTVSQPARALLRVKFLGFWMFSAQSIQVASVIQAKFFRGLLHREPCLLLTGSFDNRPQGILPARRDLLAG